VRLERDGISGDRCFYVIDDRGRLVNGKSRGELNQVTAELDGGGRLALGFPDGSRIEDEVRRGEPIEVHFRSQRRRALPLGGPFSQALSDHVGIPLRLVAPEDGTAAVDRGERGAVTLIASASVAALGEHAGERALDARRFRMSIEVDGVRAFEEDGWIGRELRVGEALLRPAGHVGRCSITSRDPETGAVDVPTLELLRELRAGAETTEPLALGVYGEVLEPGDVALGDTVEVGDADLAGRR
jgi:uncharacterized protein YcbX